MKHSVALALILWCSVFYPLTGFAKTCRGLFSPDVRPIERLDYSSLVLAVSKRSLLAREKELFRKVHLSALDPAKIDASAYASEAALMMSTLRANGIRLERLATQVDQQAADRIRKLIKNVNDVGSVVKSAESYAFKLLNYQMLMKILRAYLRTQTFMNVIDISGHVETALSQMYAMDTGHLNALTNKYPYQLFIPTAAKHGLVPFRGSNFGVHYIGLIKPGERALVDSDSFTDAQLPIHDLTHAIKIANYTEEVTQGQGLSPAEAFVDRLRLLERSEYLWSELIAETPVEKRPLFTVLRFYIEHEMSFPLYSARARHLLNLVVQGNDLYSVVEQLVNRIGRGGSDIGRGLKGRVSKDEVLSALGFMHDKFKN